MKVCTHCSRRRAVPKHSWCRECRQVRDVWRHMVDRCTKPEHPNYPHYGGRGITVCERWLKSFAAFESDMGPRPKGYSLGRMDNNGDYEPANVRWESVDQQARNTQRTIMLVYQGRHQSLPDWADELGIPRKTIWERLEAGWSHERALSTPVRRRAKLTPRLRAQVVIMSRKGRSGAQIALALNLGESTVSRILKRHAADRRGVRFSQDQKE